MDSLVFELLLYDENFIFIREDKRCSNSEILEVLLDYPSIFRKLPAYIHDDKESAIAAVKVNPDLLGDVSDRLRADKDVVLEAVKGNPSSIAYASLKLRNSEDVMLEVLSRNEELSNFGSFKIRKICGDKNQYNNLVLHIKQQEVDKMDRELQRTETKKQRVFKI